MIFKLVIEGDFCDKNICTAGSPKCDKCPRNFGCKIEKEESFRPDYTFEFYYVKCASWMPLWLAEAIKNWQL